MTTSSDQEGYSNHYYQPYNYGWNTTPKEQKMTTSSDQEGYSNHYYQPYNYGWNTTPPNQYHARVSSTERSPCDVTDFPKNHKIFNTAYNQYKTPPEINQQHGAHNKKVHFADQEKAAQVVKADDNSKNGKYVYGESIDAEADGFIKQKHKNFELAKWNTFKAL